MPPVLGPVSPSPSRLWSCAAGRRSSCAPSVSARTDSSSPFRKSSITISWPASPNAPSASMARAARPASVRRAHTTAPLPAARPEAFTTSGSACRAMKERAGSSVVNVRLAARGGGAGSEGGMTRRPQRVREPAGERRFRAHDGQIDLVLARRRDEVGGGGGGNGEIGAELGGAGIAGSGEEFRVGGVALQRPAERVLAAAPPDDQDSHFFLLNASVNAWAARFAVSTTSFTTAFASFM